MMKNRIKTSHAFVLGFLILAVVNHAPAQQVAAPPVAAQQGAARAAKIPVNAPFAQQLIVNEKKMHPEIQKLGLHAVPPGQTENAIIANNLPEKIGKVSSANDMRLVAPGMPQAVRIVPGDFWDTFVPVHSRDGKVIGFLVMEVPFATAATADAAIAEGAVLRDEVERATPDLATWFGPARP